MFTKDIIDVTEDLILTRRVTEYYTVTEENILYCDGRSKYNSEFDRSY